ncbi:MAG: DUF3343 domain-containing protein [Ruminococcaceae bacterium]|nr:DUF3343 domain-containing protein [Oscillospiraceae bacterium]
MANHYIHVGSITNAMRGKSLLEQQGIRAYVHRTTNPPQGDGCGYSLLVTGNLGQAKETLVRAGVRVVRISDAL